MISCSIYKLWRRRKKEYFENGDCLPKLTCSLGLFMPSYIFSILRDIDCMKTEVYGTLVAFLKRWPKLCKVSWLVVHLTGSYLSFFYPVFPVFLCAWGFSGKCLQLHLWVWVFERERVWVNIGKPRQCIWN